jgi:capsule polysaccharide export protein KpsE/RkpR
MEEAIKILSENIDISLEEEMQIMVSFWDTDQELVAEMTNYIVHTLDSLSIALSAKKGKENRIFIESRMNDVLDSLRYLEKQLVGFMEEEGVISLTDQVRVGVENAAAFKSEIMRKQIELAIARNSFDENNSIIIKLKSEIQTLQSKYREFFTEKPSDKLMPNFNRIPEVGVKYSRLEKEVEYFFKIIEFLGPLYEKARIDELKDVPTIQVLDRAVRPEKKDKPFRSKFVLIAFMLTFIISSYYAYFMDRSKYLQNTSD